VKAWRLAVIVITASTLIMVGGALLIVWLASRYQGPSDVREWVIESDTMSPTLKPDDVLVARKMDPFALKRGMIVTFRNEKGDVGVSRIAGLPGDRIELRHGVVIVNGKESLKHGVGLGPSSGGVELYLSVEQFPGEQGAHQIAEHAYDSIPEVTVGPGRVFMLDDNRYAWMNRYRSAQYSGLPGPQTIRAAAITGRGDDISIATKGDRAGQALDLPASAVGQ
jgi:signal peptidase I